MNFYQRYVQCCKEKKIKPASQEAADHLHCARASISAFAKSGHAPRGDIVAGAARMLDVSADYLLGLTDNPHPAEVSLSQNEDYIIKILRGMNVQGQEAVVSMAKGLLANSNYKK